MRLQLKDPALSLIKLLSVCIMVVAIFFLHSNILKLWFDETVQLSLSHLAHPEKMDAYRYVFDPVSVVGWNQRYNMDPGGYSMFVNMLSPMVKNRFHVYRIVNISAFILGVALLLRRFSKDGKFGSTWPDALLWASSYVLMATAASQPWSLGEYDAGLRKWLPFIELLRSSFSIRAYGFQFLSVAFLIYASEWHKTLYLSRYSAIASAIFIGLLLRYDFALFVAAFLSAVFLESLRKRDLGAKLRFPATWLILGAAAGGVLLAHRLAYSHQTGGIDAPLRMYYLGYAYLNKTANIHFALTDSLNVFAVLTFLFALWRISRPRHMFLESLYVMLFVIYLSLSLTGYYPMHMRVDRCLGLIVTFNVLMVAYAVSLMRQTAKLAPGAFWSVKRLFGRYGSIAPFVGAVLAAWVVFQAYGKAQISPFVEAMVSEDDHCFENLLSGQRGATVYLDRKGTPNINNYYNYLGRPFPPNKYFFEMNGPHNRQRGRKRMTIAQRCDLPLARRYDIVYIPDLQNKCEKTLAILDSLGYEGVTCSKALYRAR
jgi:hypothetical protein